MISFYLINSYIKHSVILKMQVSEIMTRDVKTIKLSSTLKKAAILMVEENIGSIVVVSKENKVVGVVTRTDILKNVVYSDPVNMNIPLEDFVDPKFLTIDASEKVESAALLMYVNRIHHILVKDVAGNLVGVLSTLDLIKLQYL